MITFDERCTACAACESICPVNAIEMKDNIEGFQYPWIDSLKCICCNKCETVCQYMQSFSKNEMDLEEVFACYANDDEIRLSSSSGGIFQLVGEYILKEKGVLFGPVWNQDFSGIQHQKIQTKEGLQTLKKSKYLQSDMGLCYREVKDCLANNMLVLFSGTPCQITGLIGYLGGHPDNLICQDIICHGVPSPKLWKEYIRKHFSEKIQWVDFRNKKRGWLKYGFSIGIYKNNKTEPMHYKNYKSSYMQFFLRKFSLRKSCYQCPAKKQGYFSDITLGDLWGSSNIIPEWKDDKGISFVTIHTEKGRKIWEQIQRGIVSKSITLQEATNQNKAYYNSVKEPTEREHFYEILDKKGYAEVESNYLLKNSLISKIQRKINKLMK